MMTALPGKELDEAAEKCRAAGAAGVQALPYDFSDPSGLQALCEAAWDAFGGLDVVYCNAGISQRTLVEDTSEAMIRKIMEMTEAERERMAERCIRSTQKFSKERTARRMLDIYREMSDIHGDEGEF